MLWLVRNWQLKLGAVALATILYTGFVYSGSFTEQTFLGLPIELVNQPDGSFPLTQQLQTVDVRYRLATDLPARVTAESFAVSVDLSRYDMSHPAEPQQLPVQVRPLIQGLEILSYAPASVPVAIDRLGQKQVRVVVDRGAIPAGLEIGTPVVSSPEVTASGPQTQLGRVERAEVRVQIDESGIDVSNQFDLVAVDVDGRVVPSVDLDPSSVTVQIDVRTVETTKTVPIRPALNGTPADGFEIASITIEPAVVTLRGGPDELGAVDQVSTEPIDVGGLSQSAQLDAALVVPAGVRLADGVGTAVVSVRLRPAVSTRTVLVGLVCRGADEGVACLPQLDQVAMVLRGRTAALEALDPARITPVLDVSGLDAGEHTVTPVVSLPNGIELVSISPSSVTVVIQPPATPSPSPS
jgi:YbbR domain-containing protein